MVAELVTFRFPLNVKLIFRHFDLRLTHTFTIASNVATGGKNIFRLSLWVNAHPCVPIQRHGA